MPISRIFVAVILTTLGVTMTTSAATAQDAAVVKQYMYVLRLVPRLHKAEAWTDKDNAAVSAYDGDLLATRS